MRDKYFKLFDELPPPIAERAKRNFDRPSRYSYRQAHEPHSLRSAIDYGMSWIDTPEGSEFWQEVYSGGLPSTKNLPPLE